MGPSQLSALSPRSSCSSTQPEEQPSSQQQPSFLFHDSNDVIDFQDSQDEAEQMMAGFEAMLNEVGGARTYEGDNPASNRCGLQESEGAEDSSDDEGSLEPSGAQTDSCDQAVVSHDSSGDQEEAKGKQQRGSGDVEEGEVSDSSEEVSKASPQEVSNFDHKTLM